jgi:hypothetical protein
MTTVVMLRSIQGGASERSPGFEVAYVTAADGEGRVALADAWALPLERGEPVRRFASYKGQRHLPGLWWSATDARHVGYESWLERDHLMAFDFDPGVRAIASQPFWLFWTGENGRSRSHAPDYFVRRDDGSGVVVDCRPVERRGERDVAAFEATARACSEVGWDYRLVGMLDRVLAGNLRWLAGYRHPRHLLTQVAEGLRAVVCEPRPLMEAACEVGDPVAVLPVLFHLMWRHELLAEMSVPLGPDTVLSPGVAA